jgi:colanic acid biosynthesis glycosyl transferase WcaI
MQRLFFLNRFFLPDHSATSQLVGDLATYLAATGREVHVIASQQLYDNPKERLPAREIISGVHVHRVPTAQFGRSNLFGRGLDYFSFYASAWSACLLLVQREDVIIALTDPPLVSVVAMRVARRRGALLINWLQDIYPEVAVELGVPFLKGPIARGLARLRDRCLKVAVANVVVGERMAERVASHNASTDRIHVIANWSDDEVIHSVAPSGNYLRRKWRLQDKFVVGYSGNLGRAHEYDTMLAAAERLKDNPSIVFLFMGGGHHIKTLARTVKEKGLRSFRFFGYQDRTILNFSLSVPDVHWISLKPTLEGLIVPSKMYGIAAVGRPIIAITAKTGEIARLVQQYRCGIVIEPGNADELSKALVRLSTDSEDCDRMGRNARAMLDARFSRRHAFGCWRTLISAFDCQKGAELE